jgi:hypothetical protein
VSGDSKCVRPKSAGIPLMFIFVFLNFSPTILWFVVFTLGANWRIGYWYKIDAWTECCCILPRTPSCVTTPALSTTHLSSDAARTTTCATAIWNPSCTSATPQVITKPKSDGNCLFVALCPLLTLEEFDFRQTKQNKKKWLLSIWLFFLLGFYCFGRWFIVVLYVCVFWFISALSQDCQIFVGIE